MNSLMDDKPRRPAAGADEEASAVKRALMARRLRDSSDAPNILAGEPIAVVGVGCRFPGGADTPAAFWKLLREGVDAIVTVSPRRWNAQALYDPDPQAPGKMTVQWGGFLQDAHGFDADFFGIAPREAEQMDPQQRLLLEVAWEALESAGQTREHIAGSATGVFVGVSTNDYQNWLLSDRQQISAYAASGTAHSIVANRLSYLLNLTGPSMALDTACSSSLVAVHLACQSLRVGECDMALAGGVNLILTPEPMIALSKAHMLAPDGRCKTFDASANGYARGEGCGMVVLKRLAEALADSDNVLAVIRGSAVNQDGRTTGLTAPNGRAQQAVIRAALANAGLAADDVTFIETHGTGTSLGDPIEVEALAAVYGDGQSRDPAQPVFLGSVKTNIGHLEAAAGMAGLIKLVLAIESRQIPPNLNFHVLNPNITLSGTPFVIPTAPQPWVSGRPLRCAAVSSFGFGGTNAHLILEAPPAVLEQAAGGRAEAQADGIAPVHILPISAHTPAALRALAARYETYLQRERQPLPAVCYTAAVHRTHHLYRFAPVGDTREAMADLLGAFVRGNSSAAAAADPSRLVWVFTGQGADVCEVPVHFLAAEPRFREALAACDQALARHLNWSVADYLIGMRPELAWRDTSVAQPVIFAVQVALAALWRSWGLEPEAVVGHSVGEIAAAHVAGILSLADAAWLVCQRGRLMQQGHGQGQAASVEATLEEAEALIRRYPGQVFVGATNSPVSVILSGQAAALDDIMAGWKETGRFFRYLPVDYAFHSEQASPFGEQLAHLAVGVKPLAAQIPFVSTLTGRFCAGPELDASYWGRNVAERVRFAEAMATLLEAGQDVFLELGPHPLLQRPMQQCIAAHLPRHPQSGPKTIAASLRQGLEPDLALRQSLATLYMAGLSPAWQRLYGRRQRPVALPAYAWQHESFWPAPRGAGPEPRQPAAGSGAHPFLGQRHQSPLRPDVVFETRLDPERLPILLEHRLHGMAVVPAVVIFDMALSAAVQAWRAASPLRLENVLIQAPLIIEPGQERNAQIILQPDGPSSAIFHVYSGVATGQAEVDWTEHAQGRVSWDLGEMPDDGVDLSAWRQSCQTELPPAQLYERFRTRGLTHGDLYQRIVALRVGDRSALGQIRSESGPGAASDGAYQLAPPLFESCLQVVAAALFGERALDAEALYVPLALDQLVLYRRPGPTVWCHARIATSPDPEASARPPETYHAELEIVDEAGRPVARLEGLSLKRVGDAAVRRLARQAAMADEAVYQIDWQRADDRPAPLSGQDDGLWLLFADSAGVAQAIKARRELAGQPCVLVVAADGYSQLAPDTYRINPAQPDDFARLWRAAIGSQALACRAVLFLWDAMPDAGPGILQGALNAAQMVARQASAETRLWFVVRETPTAGAGPQPTRWADAVGGLANTFALEHGGLWGGCIGFASTLPAERAAEAIWSKVLTADEDQIELRREGGFVARLRPLPLPAEARAAIKSDSTYLVTGGLGAVGQETIRWLAAQGARHLVVVSRRSASSPEAEALRRSLPEAVHLGFFQADVSNRAALADVLQAVRLEFPGLAGVFHLAGVLDDGVLLNQSWQRFAPVWTIKAEAAWYLSELTEGSMLDYFVLFSSVAAVLGAAGQANYAAANAGLDGLARDRRRRGLPALSVNWGVWGQVGMAARLSDGDQARLEAYGLRPMTPEHGLALLGRLLAGGYTQAIVLPVDWRRFGQALPGWRRRSLLRELLPAATPVESGAATTGMMRETLRRLAAPEQLEELKHLLTEQVCDVLGLAHSHLVDPRRGFFQLGMDSLMGVELQQRLQRLLGVDLPATTIFDYPSVESLAGYLAGRLRLEENGETHAGGEATDARVAAALMEVERLNDNELDALLGSSAHD